MIKPGGFFSRRWRGEVRLPIVFWRDLLAVGTSINLLASFLALVVASQGVDIRVAAALHFAPLPYNLFLFLAVWRLPQRTAWMRAIAAVWLAVMTLL